ncbi:MAG: DUF167 domain-containing protein [Nanoarchaeota archaeon]|nr:DUF167 domain-containing protein [Nanoarchaeota archaeon]
MDINKYVKNKLVAVKVIPHAQQSKIIEENKVLKIYLTSIPDKNKANMELINFFKKEFKMRVRIKRGEKSREKVLEILS